MKISNIFMILIFFIVYLPNIDIYSVSVYQIFIWLFIIYYYKKIFLNKVNKKIKILFLFFIMYFILILLFDNVEIKELNHKVPKEWFKFGGWQEFNYFLGKYEAIAQLIHILEGMLLYFLIRFKYITIRIKNIKKYLFVVLLIQYFFIFYQKYILCEEWVTGTVYNVQALGSFSLIVIVLFGKKGRFNIFVSVLAFLLIIISQKNSSLVTLILLLFFYNYSKIFMIISLIANILIGIIIPYYDLTVYIYIIVNILLKKGSFYTLNMRILIWKEVFLEILKKNLIFGTNGIITSFPENIIWYFLQPYGMLGIIFFFYFFYKKRVDKKYYLLFGILFCQGISYFGLIIPPISYTFFSLLGYYSNKNEKINLIKEKKWNI